MASGFLTNTSIGTASWFILRLTKLRRVDATTPWAERLVICLGVLTPPTLQYGGTTYLLCGLATGGPPCL